MKEIAQLIRLPAGFSAASNIIAAYFLSTGGQIQWPVLLKLMVVSLCLYYAGMGLNDCFDYHDDRLHRRNRPLPGGRLRLSQAWLISIGLLLLGLLVSLSISTKTSAVALLLVIVIVLYDSKVLSAVPAALVMGFCRYLNWSLALVLIPMGLTTMLLPLPLMLYVSGLTLLANAETANVSRTVLYQAIVFFLLTLFILIYMVFAYASNPGFALLLVSAVSIYFVIVIKPVWQAMRPDTVQYAVGQLVMAVIIMDATVLMIFAYYVVAACVLLLLVAGRMLGRKLYVS